MADDTDVTAPADPTRPCPDLTPAPVRKRQPMSRQLVEWLGTGWDEAPVMTHPALDNGVAARTGDRRAQLSAALPGQLIVVPAGQQPTRANDTQYPFRAELVVRVADRRDRRGRRAGARARTGRRS